jgi:hypothetical protein
MARKQAGLPVVLGVAGMAFLATWGMLEYGQRQAPGLGGRLSVLAPASAPAHYRTICEWVRCAVALSEIRWYTVDGDTLPTVVCPTGGAALIGCYERETKALTLVAARVEDDVLVRHELMHAALGGGSEAERHDCRWFNSLRGTWWAHMGCG